jgi:hypothetical protein
MLRLLQPAADAAAAADLTPQPTDEDDSTLALDLTCLLELVAQTH